MIIWSKYTNLCKLGAFVCEESPPIEITLPKFMKKYPKK